MPPRATQYLVNPAQFVDYRRFWSDELLAAFKEQQTILRAATPDIPITTNFVFGNWVPVDHHRWSDAVDLVAIDNYPSGTGLAPEEQTAFAADQARGWARRGEWLLMEQAPGAIIDGARLRTKEPGRMTRMSLSHVARGSRGALFFQWRASAGGSEQFHPGMVPHAGQESRRFLEVCELGGLLGRLGGDQRQPGRGRSGCALGRRGLVGDAGDAPAVVGPRLPRGRAVRASAVVAGRGRG